ncbi:MAG TPA: glycoside hydrolase family 5 protein, partial [Fibrobacter sp.]|nr:glycoside hydrolase family 5 protein [Fibrobacter sp.]
MNFKKIFGILWVSSLAVFAFDGPVDYYGALSVSGSKIVSTNTELPVPLRGVSLGPANKAKPSVNFFNATTVSNMVDVWKAEIIRAPLEYTTLANYQADSAYYRKIFDNVIDACIAKNVYVIVDWRSSTLNSSAEEQGVALAFFLRIAQKYGSVPNVIFELFDRPESDEWASISSYQQTLVTVLRSHSSNLILIGTPSYSQDVEMIVDAPITGVNIAYSFHFYAGSQTPTSLSSNSKTYRDKIKTTLSAGYPVFVSEFTTTHSDGGLAAAAHYETHDLLSSEKWLSFLDSNGLSYVAWQVNDDYAGSSFFGKEEAPAFDQTVAANWGNTSLMTESGIYIYNKLQEYALLAPWRQALSSSSSAESSSSSAPVSSSSINSSSSSLPAMTIIDDFNDGNN